MAGRVAFEQMAQDSPNLQRFIASPEYPRVMVALEKQDPKGRWALQLNMAISRGLAGPLPYELLTRGERLRLCERVKFHATELANLFYAIHGDAEEGRRWPFEMQVLLDGFAVAAAHDYKDYLEGSPMREILDDPETEGLHIARSAIYHMLMDCMPEMMETLADGADFWAERGDQTLAKPNHKNAKRLYFLRVLTNAFVQVLGTPMRKETLEIASVYFDCSDLKEADLSNIAPVRKRRRAQVS